jgi:uncharacterized DUF497 family protein
MEFDFNNRKSLVNKIKYEIVFVEAQALWNDPDRIEIPAKNRFLIEGSFSMNSIRIG